MKREPSFRRRPNKRALVFNVRVMLSTWCDVHVTPPSEWSQTPLWRWRTGTPLWGNWDTHIPREGTAQLKITAPPCSASLEERKHYSVVISSLFQIPVWNSAPERWLKWISWLIWLLFTAEKPLLLSLLSWYPLQCQKKWKEILKWFLEDFVYSEMINGMAWKQPKLKMLALNLSGFGLDRKKSRVSCQTVKQLPAWRCKERALCFWNQLKDFFPPQIIKGSTGKRNLPMALFLKVKDSVRLNKHLLQIWRKTKQNMTMLPCYFTHKFGEKHQMG